MQVPNRYHHSKKEQKRKLKPQALRQAKARLQALKKRLQKGDASFLVSSLKTVHSSTHRGEFFVY